MSGTKAQRRLLIANRGEIARRIMCSARQMGFHCIAIYSDADAASLHRIEADQAVNIGPADPAQSYLNIDAVMRAVCATGANFIHPGYGFLAENADFAGACEQANVSFVGPSAAVIRKMGDKAQAKAIMEKASIPCVPGYNGDDQSSEHLAAEAEKIGWPVMIKAAAGGGGRGMRLVENASDFASALVEAQSESLAAFGDDRMLIEKAVANARHIEIQIMRDGKGNTIHLGERDCSVQRRHQKLIEETPSPYVTPAVRQLMAQAAINAAEAIDYKGAGTVEFLLDESDQWYFMEMNTRLQVEHPVTEAVTGLDLVRMQLDIALGNPLAVGQSEVKFDGHAIEVRLCAEDPQSGFMPQVGKYLFWQPSDEVRTDHAIVEGGHVASDYDSMIAKLVAHGKDREDARTKLIHALENTVLLGVKTNRTFLQNCLAHENFAAGRFTTEFIDHHQNTLFDTGALEEDEAAVLAAALIVGAPPTQLPHGFDTPLRLVGRNTSYQLFARALRGGRCEISDLDRQLLRTVTIHHVDDAQIRYSIDGTEQNAWLACDSTILHLQIGGTSWRFEDTSRRAENYAETLSDGAIRAIMSGRVMSIAVDAGQWVEEGQQVLVVEAMKMHHTHNALSAGRVDTLHVEPGDQVEAGQILLEIAVEPQNADLETD